MTFPPRFHEGTLAGQIAIITGAGGQLGSALTRAFREAGAKVVGLDLRADPSQRVLPMDVTSTQSVTEAFASIQNDIGTPTILVNNAGIGVYEPFLERSDNDFDRVLDVNLKGTFHCIAAFSKARAAISAGVTGPAAGSPQPSAIVNIGSIYGVVSSDPRIYTDCARMNSEVYSATKAGVIQMTRYFAVHLAAQGIRVNAVSPGGIYNPANPQGSDFVRNYTQRCPLGRMATVDDMVGPVLFLASPAASYVTGQNLTVDGGFTAW